MSKTTSKLWLIGPPVSMVLLAAVLYVKQPWARDLVDTHCGWIKNGVGKYAPPFDVVFLDAPGAGLPATPPPPAPAPKAAEPGASATPRPFDLQKVLADESLWPKSVLLKKAADFPAVRNGRVMGSIRVPVGAETHVKKVANGKLGLEYQGGGAWIGPEDTDFVERAKVAWH